MSADISSSVALKWMRNVGGQLTFIVNGMSLHYSALCVCQQSRSADLSVGRCTSKASTKTIADRERINLDDTLRRSQTHTQSMLLDRQK